VAVDPLAGLLRLLDRLQPMRAWRGQTVPSLTEFGPAPAVRLHDTATGTLVTSTPSTEGPARLYVCGITPYDATHIGHASTYIAFDLLNRGWRDAGHEVRYVQNVTDVDDPLLERAARDGEDWRALADREIERFRGDCEALRILPPDEYTGVVEAIDIVVEMVEQLRSLGHAYEVDGDWYFSVRSDPAFGSVGHLSEEEMLRLSAERGGDPDRPGKKDPLDCLLWRAERPGEPSWPSPLGSGRPGWHIECSAIALSGLGEGFDVQGGGSDLVFPHHEMSASEAQAAFPGLTFAHTYAHAGMVAYEGEKMSKSRGNLVFVSELRATGLDPTVIRLAIMANHYRSDWEWTDEAIPAAEQRLRRWRDALATTSTEQAAQLVLSVRTALARDLDTPAAFKVLDEWAQGWHAGDGSGADAVRALLDARLGLLV
jgi:L-cysteine:1D-myo-inositol 2-amino-2-deoxy-alpha-D-glucopyranoside ligase